MNYPSIRIEGAILSPDIVDKLEDAPGQRPTDFGFDNAVKVKDEIARAWADAQDYWRIFQRKLQTIRIESPATTETRNNWIVPLLGLLGYQIDPQPRGVEINGKNYAISHRVTNRAQTPIHIIGYREPAGLDRKPEKSVLRMSAHAMLQEYLNLQDELYGLVTNGRVLRLLRDSSRLIKLSYLEFDLDRIFTDGLFADFAVLYRLIHASRLPSSLEASAESLVERYHQDSLDSGARIRDGLSRAVARAILDFANGFLAHPNNDALRAAINDCTLSSGTYYQHMLRLIYRLLFLMVIEERDLIFTPKTNPTSRETYDQYYSLRRLRHLSEKRYLADRRRHDLWMSLLATFRLFEANGPGNKLNIAPLAGDLFRPDAIGMLGGCSLGNDVLLGCLRSLSLYQHPDNKQIIRVNYAALNVEEFGSVYEGLLEYKPVFVSDNDRISFAFAQGDERAATGSHYTPDDLVQPLIKHSLDYLIADALKDKNPEKALLLLRVADISCGSGHILLAAARRIATELAIVRTGEEQPSPTAFRAAVRDVIRECIYGVDLNPLAVELCKVALWLEAHNPGAPLNFLDHHIKCGNSIVGFTHRDDLQRGVPDEAFAAMPGDNKNTAAIFRKRNKTERSNTHQGMLDLASGAGKHLGVITSRWRDISNLPDSTPHDYEVKKQRYLDFTQGEDAWLLNLIAAMPIAQFYLPKISENSAILITDADFRRYWTGEWHPQGEATGAAGGLAVNRRFFHWFLEFPEIIEQGGFDCILGNPPYLGSQSLSGTYGHSFCSYVKWQYAPTGLSDLVVYFLRRIYCLIKPNGFTAFITTNSIKDGDNRRDGLDHVVSQGGDINMAVRGIKWPGRANVVVSLVSIHKGRWSGRRLLGGQEVPFISTYFEDSHDSGEPNTLLENANRIFQGSIFLGDGFLLTYEEADKLVESDPLSGEVIFPIINGREVNNVPNQQPQRKTINFFDWPLEKAQVYGEAFQRILRLVKPERDKVNRTTRRERWWQYAERATGLYTSIHDLPRCFVTARVTKHLNFSALPTNVVFLNNLYVFATDRWDLYAVVQSTIHEVWARKHSMSLKQDLQYSPSDCFATYAFPDNLWSTDNLVLANAGEQYHEHRKNLMRQLWLGLTDIYNLFHAPDLTPARVAKVSKKPEQEAEAGYHGILELRRLHAELDHAVLNAYGWLTLKLDCGFHELEYLAENDRVRYTISPDARKEVLKRLLDLNHQRAALEATTIIPAKVKGQRKRVATSIDVSEAAEGIPQQTDMNLPSEPDIPLIPIPKEKIEKGKAVLDVLALLYAAEGNRLDRAALEIGLILMRHENLRKRIVTRGLVPQAPSNTPTRPHIEHMDSFLMEFNGSQISLSTVYLKQFVTLGPKATSLADLQRQAIGQDALQQAREAMDAVKHIELTCATPDKQFNALGGEDVTAFSIGGYSATA